MVKMVNIEQRRIKGQKIAICFDTYAPAHLGHYRTIIQAKRQNDGCLIIVSGQDNQNGMINGITFNNRFRSMRELFSEDEKISVSQLDESDFINYHTENLELFINKWCTACKEIIERNIVKQTTGQEVELVWYVTSKYCEWIKANFLGSEIVLVDNKIGNLVTDDIVKNAYKYWNYIMEPFRKYYSNNFLFFGTASTGKTNLVRDIARALNAPYTDEYARRYEYIYNVRDEELRVADLHNMGVGQFNNNRDAITSAANNGLVFADTDTMITKCYSRQYLAPTEYEEVETIFDYYIKKQIWALIFVIPPVTTYTDDGFRDMSHSDETTRWEMHEMFMAELKSYGLMDKVRYLNSNNFYETYLQTLKYIEEYLKIEYDADII